jgi:ferredoxin--NADP+ reductase
MGTGELEVLPADLVVRSVGYRGIPLPGLPVDERSGTVPNEEGRVLRNGRRSPGEYVAGWIKRGPSGVVGTNKHDARETVAALLADAADGDLRAGGPRNDLVEELVARGADPVLLDDWRAIDAAEIALGATRGRNRTTLHEREALLAAARAAAARPR